MPDNDERTGDHPPEQLIELASRHGVGSGFYDFDGSHQPATASTLVKVLAALGVDASSPERIAAALADAEDEPWRRTLPPVVVLRSGRRTHVPVHVADGDTVTVHVELDAEAGGGRRDLEQVDLYVPPRTVDGRTVGRATVEVPDDLPLGWHDLVATTPGGAPARSSLVVVPDRLELPFGLDERRGWGFMAQLYSVRSRRSWGVGDLADLREMAWLAGGRGADFVLINPLHAAEPVGPMTPSPYLPVTRRFVNPLYVRVEEIPETGYLTGADRALVEAQAEKARPLSEDPGPIDRDTAWTAKRTALEAVFAVPRSATREAGFVEFRAEQGQGLEDFATWCALSERFQGQEWPPGADDRGSDVVRGLKEELADRITYYCWLQWVADEQLAAAQDGARKGGMRLGIMHDLAVGVHPTGADSWAMREALARGVSVGAPPDMFNQQGQDWSQPPWSPEGLERTGYRPYRDMLRTVLRHAGAIRIDHILGLVRLWWIPQGSSARDGAYVSYDHEALIGILCLEAHRAGAVVIGEDLGIFEPWVRDYLTERGVLGTSVLWFERRDNRLLPPESYRRLALTTVTTHDLPPTAGYLAGEHVDLRDRLGLLNDPVEDVRQEAREERQQLVDSLAERGLLGEEPSEREIVEAMHRYVLASPSVLVGVSLADAVGERRSQNQPGTDREYPNWKVPLADSDEQLVLVEDLFENDRLRSLVEALRE